MGLLGLGGGGGLRGGGGRLFGGGGGRRLFNGGGGGLLGLRNGGGGGLLGMRNGGCNNNGCNVNTDRNLSTNTNNRTNTNNNTNTNPGPNPGPNPPNTNGDRTKPVDNYTPGPGIKNVPADVMAPSPDKNQIEAWRQGGRGNCASVAAIKAATDVYGKDKVFSGVERLENGGYNIQMQDGRKVSLSAKELDMARQHSDFREQGKGKDTEFANLAFAAMAKNKQELTGMRSYGQSINSLNDGEDPRAAAKWLGIPKSQVEDLTHKDKTGKDGIVAWNNGHAVSVDRREGANGRDSHVYDRNGSEAQYDNRRNIYPAAYGFKPLPPETTPPNPNTTTSGTSPVNGATNVTPPPATTTTTTPPPPATTTTTTPPPATDTNRVDRPAPVTDIPLSYTHKDFDKALEAARQLGRPVVIKGGASWCPPCQAMAKNSFPDSKVQEQLKKGAVFVDIEADRHGDTPAQQAQAKRLLDQLGVSTYPTTMVATVVDRGGTLSAVVNDGRAGGMNADALSQWLGSTLPDAQAIMAKRFGPQQ